MATARRVLSWSNTASAVGVTVLVGSQCIAAAFVFGWALAGLFHMPPTITWALEAVLVACAIAATYWFARQAFRADPPFVPADKA